MTLLFIHCNLTVPKAFNYWIYKSLSHEMVLARKVPTELGILPIGPGTVGMVLLNQIREQCKSIREKYGVDIVVHAVANSRNMLVSDGASALDLSTWEQDLRRSDTKSSLGKLVDHLKSSNVQNRLIVDCTASNIVPLEYANWLQSGIHVVTPNKKLNSESYAQYAAVKSASSSQGTHYFYEGTVGAGLPVISTLKMLLDTGDKIETIEGIFSGTMSYIFNNLSPDKKFIDVINEAKESGYTEPDPRDDLSGTDVTRKIVILARECGSLVELEDVETQSLIPPGLEDRSVNVNSFLDQMKEVRSLVMLNQ